MEKYRVSCAVFQKDAKTRRVLGKDEMNTLCCWNRLHYLHDEGKMASEYEKKKKICCHQMHLSPNLAMFTY